MGPQRTLPSSRSMLAALLLLAALLALLFWPRGDRAPDAPVAIATPLPSDLSSPAAPRRMPPAAVPPDSDVPPPATLDGRLDALMGFDVDLARVFAVCAVDPPLSAAVGHLVIGDPEAVPYDGRLVPIIDGDAYLMVRFDDDGTAGATGVLGVDGYRPAPIDWTWGTGDAPGSCTPEPVRLVPGDAVVTGVVRNAEGEPEGKVFVEGCGMQARTAADGSYAMDVMPGTCTVQAFRRDGLLTASSEPATVTVRAGRDVVVDLDLPALPKAGLGLMVRQDEDGIWVQGVLEGTAAADVGMAEGDRFVQVAGEPVDPMSLEDFIQRAHGDAGTEVEVLVERADGTLERFLLDRRVLARDG